MASVKVAVRVRPFNQRYSHTFYFSLKPIVIIKHVIIIVIVNYFSIFTPFSITKRMAMFWIYTYVLYWFHKHNRCRLEQRFFYILVKFESTKRLVMSCRVTMTFTVELYLEHKLYFKLNNSRKLPKILLIFFYMCNAFST